MPAEPAGSTEPCYECMQPVCKSADGWHCKACGIGGSYATVVQHCTDEHGQPIERTVLVREIEYWP